MVEGNGGRLANGETDGQGDGEIGTFLRLQDSSETKSEGEEADPLLFILRPSTPTKGSGSSTRGKGMVPD